MDLLQVGVSYPRCQNCSYVLQMRASKIHESPLELFDAKALGSEGNKVKIHFFVWCKLQVFVTTSKDLTTAMYWELETVLASESATFNELIWSLILNEL